MLNTIVKIYCILQNTLTEISFKKLNKPIRMQTASITTLNTNFRSMTTSIEIQPTLQANYQHRPCVLLTIPEKCKLQSYDPTSGKSESWEMSTNDSKLHDRCIFCKIANLQDPETRILYQVTNYKFELHDYILTIKTQSSGTCSDSSRPISYFKRCKYCTFCYLVTLFTQCTYFFIIMYQLPFGA